MECCCGSLDGLGKGRKGSLPRHREVMTLVSASQNLGIYSNEIMR
jgi:hypothetical protein